MDEAIPPLDGVRVLEFGTGIAAAFAGRYLAGFGADVVHVDIDTVAPLTREERIYLLSGKRLVDADPAALRMLAGEADIIVEDCPPGVLESWGCDAATLRAERPRLVYVSVTPFGRHGPYARFEATNIVTFAMGGIMSVTGDPDRAPLVTGGSQAEYLGGLNAAGAAVTAYYGALVRGEGDWIDISMQECLASNMELYASGTSYGDPVQVRMGNQVRPIWAIYPCGERWAGVFCLQRQVPALFAVLDDPELDDPRYLDPLQRDEVQDELTAKLYTFFAEHDPAQVLALGRAHKVPFGVAMTPADLLEADGLRERGFFDEVDTEFGVATMPGRPFPGIPWRPLTTVATVTDAGDVLRDWRAVAR